MAVKWPISYKDRYVKYNKILRSCLKSSEEIYYNKKLKTAQGNMKQTWQTINSVLKRNKPCDEVEIKAPDGVKSKANYANDYFLNTIDALKSEVNTVTNKHFTDYLNPNVNYSMYLKPVTEDEIMKYCKEIKTNAIGYDGISPEILKLSIKYTSKPLTYIINQCFKNGTFPEDLKLAKVIMIHKTGDKSDIKNKRPISILSAISKIFEKSIHTRVQSYLEKFDLISKNQHGFRHNHSTESAVLNFTTLNLALNQNKFSIGLFLNFSKAFKCIEHKLDYSGSCVPALSLMKDYISCRKQAVYYKNEYSSFRELKYGVPQGSIVGPLLFCLR